jgi:hypothetical protein
LAELDARTDAMIEALMRPLRALTVPERRAIVCMSFVRMAMAHVADLIAQEPAEAGKIIAYRDETIRDMGSEIEGKSHAAAHMQDSISADRA